MGFRLRYLHHDLELPEGQFIVGRHASCQLSLDDPLVSRRHALLTVTAACVFIEDLQSRNGVLVNGRRIQSKVALEASDRLLIGAQELTLLVGRDGTSLASSSGNLANAKLTLPKMSTSEFRTNPPPAPIEVDGEPSMVRRADAFNLLGSVAEKALAMGRADEAERILASALNDAMDAARNGKKVGPSVVDVAARFAAKLATATGKGQWADFVIEIYATQERPCPAIVIDELYNAYRKVNAVDLARLRGYLDSLRNRLPTFGPAERFLFQRLEGLERLAALR